MNIVVLIGELGLMRVVKLLQNMRIQHKQDREKARKSMLKKLEFLKSRLKLDP